MYSGICICMFFAVITVRCIGQETAGSDNGDPLATDIEQRLTAYQRTARTSPSSGQLKPIQRFDGNVDQRTSLAMLAKYLQQSRKDMKNSAYHQKRSTHPCYSYFKPQDCNLHLLTQGSSGNRYSLMGNKVQSLDPNHRIKDRDYMGWMDFGRRSAEEYEYSS
ncbi:cholecystokinin isoform X1 [Protopterus annectens]|uniref:cholecystokinin isoform X1 n=1 Tax=Protopterus annectens TaxID=7888 RepID=UPI001CFBCDDD|nr:cholecystokinin isoform X1 [Protopterus annectens]